MANVLIVVYLLIVLALIAVILMQRSEGGALGIGGGGNANFNTTRSSANLLTRTTAILAALFFITAIALTVLNEVGRESQSILDSAGQVDANSNTTVLDALDSLQADDADINVPEGAAENESSAPVEEDAPDLAVPETAPPAEEESTGQ